MALCALWFISLLGFMVHKEKKTEALGNNIPGRLVHKYSLANFWAALPPLVFYCGLALNFKENVRMKVARNLNARERNF